MMAVPLKSFPFSALDIVSSGPFAFLDLPAYFLLLVLLPPPSSSFVS